MEDLFDRHRELNDRLAEYQSWLNDFNEEDRGKIGLKQSVIADVCQLRQVRVCEPIIFIAIVGGTLEFALMSSSR